MWRFIARWFMRVVGFLDKNSGAVTAVATIAIGFLTYKYVTYSKKQWETMNTQVGITQRQLTDFEESQSARLVIDFKAAPCADTGSNVLCNGTFVVVNSGPTVAAIVWEASGQGAGQGDGPSSFQGTVVEPIPETKSSGPWLPVGGKREIPASVTGDRKEDLDNRRAFAYASLSVAYKDIFGRVFWIFDCYKYTPSGFRQCPPQTRILPSDWNPSTAPPQSKKRK